ncbi:hypothetical protein MBLNU13_g02215t1 [Cladosporium sp. NU13]
MLSGSVVSTINSVARSLRDPSWHRDPASGSSAPVDQISREVETFAAGEIHTAKGRRDNKPRQDVRGGSTSMTGYLFGEVSEKRKEKAPDTRVYEVDSSDHLSASSPPNAVQYELEVGSSEDSTPPTKGKAPALKATSHGISHDSSKKTKHRADKIPGV